MDSSENLAVLAQTLPFEEWVKALERHGVSQDRITHGIGQENGETILFYASDAGDERVMVHLVEKLDFDVNARDKDDQTPLHRNAQWGNCRQVQWLVENGASIQLKNKDGATPLDVAFVNSWSGPKDVSDIMVTAATERACVLRGQYCHIKGVQRMIQQAGRQWTRQWGLQPHVIQLIAELVCPSSSLSGMQWELEHGFAAPISSAGSFSEHWVQMWQLKSGSNVNLHTNTEV
jgi:hypothetical protein